MGVTSAQINIDRLEKVRRSGYKITARCPACAAEGGDKGGCHFFQNTETGQFGCAKFAGDREHRREIFRLVGIKGERDPVEEMEWRRGRMKVAAEEHVRRKVLHALRANRASIIARHPWAPEDVWENSPQRIDCALVKTDPRHFLASLFPQSATIWTGDVFHSGTRHACHWRTVAEWQGEPNPGPMTTPAVWKPGTTSRSAGNVSANPYVVLDFDGFDGVQPNSAGEVEQHRLDSLALVRWIRDGLSWRLAAIVWTGSKSIHAWFHTPPNNVLQSLRNSAATLGIDAGLIGHPEHPCRLPGQRHTKTGGISSVFWLQTEP
jgi:hypothetical protein